MNLVTSFLNKNSCTILLDSMYSTLLHSKSKHGILKQNVRIIKHNAFPGAILVLLHVKLPNTKD